MWDFCRCGVSQRMACHELDATSNNLHYYECCGVDVLLSWWNNMPCEVIIAEMFHSRGMTELKATSNILCIVVFAVVLAWRRPVRRMRPCGFFICCDAPLSMSYVALVYVNVLLWCYRADGILVPRALVYASVMLYSRWPDNSVVLWWFCCCTIQCARKRFWQS
jgi:hypothetical protein